MNKKVYLSEEGLKNLTAKYESLKEELNNNSKELSLVFSVSNKENENAAYESLIMRERVLVSEIKSLAQVLENAEVINNETLDENVIGLEDVVTIKMEYSNNEFEIIDVRLDSTGNLNIGESVSINSPLGRAIFGKKVGDTANYKINGKEINVIILNKSKSVQKKLKK